MADIESLLKEKRIFKPSPDFARQAMLWNFENVFGWVSTSRQVIEALDAG